MERERERERRLGSILPTTGFVDAISMALLSFAIEQETEVQEERNKRRCYRKETGARAIRQ